MYLVKKPILPSGFEIFNASAGSGKTYQLTKSYLNLILSDTSAQKLGEILALTFTNKAVSEMKDRILDSLYVFGNSNVSKENNPLFMDLVSDLGFSQKEMENKSSLVLKLLLHNYNFFEISTIDKFSHRIIKTFAKELGISQSFEVELDDDVILDEAIGRLLQNSSDHKQLQEVLIDFSLQKIDANKSWNIIYDLKEIGKLLFKENHHDHVQFLKNKSIADFDLLRESISKKQQAYETKATDLAQQALETIYALNFEDADFSRETLPNHFKKVIAGERSEKLYNNKLEDGLTNGTLLLKRVEKDGTQLFAKLLEIYLEIKTCIYTYLFFKNAYANILPLTVLHEISKEILAIQKEREILHISEFNKLISKEIANQPVPYLYEKLGERYRHYFIDEFQDTSKIQWQNLIPLIGNALETEELHRSVGTLLVVGDAKQSIYRWRGGDPKQFLNLSSKSNNPFTVSPQINTLNTNWRSFDTIIGFNNDFFTRTANFLREDIYQNLYVEQCQQESNKRKGGYVQIDFAPKDVEDLDVFYCGKVLETIKRIIDKGFSFHDICVLVRKNKHGVLLADFLAAHSIPIISSEALLLSNNPEVQFLVSLLRFMENPTERALEFDVLEHLFNKHDNKHNLIVEHLGNLTAFLKLEYAYDIDKECSLPLLLILERAISAFGLIDSCGAHVIHFLDLVLEIGERSGVGIHGFLKFWDLKKGILAISAPQNQNAVQLMTVHKSKGLEFRFVIFPFANSKINDRTKTKKLWVPLSENTEQLFSEVLVNAGKELEHYSKTSNEIYSKENNLSQLDDFNVLYVALTRAVEGLFILTQEDRGETYGSLFKNYLVQKGLWTDDTFNYPFGVFSGNRGEKPVLPQTKPIPYIYTETGKSSKLAITSKASTNESLQWGNIIHDLLSEIDSPKDIEAVLSKAKNRGDLSDRLADKIRDILQNLVNHPQLSKYYLPGNSSRNEVEIMDAGGRLFRPDRLAFEGDQVTIIDYKTGERNPQHLQQLETYASLLKQLNLVVSQKILVYIGNKIEPVFI